MRHLNSHSKLGRNPAHRRATLRNLVTGLMEHGRIIWPPLPSQTAAPAPEENLGL